ncbi:hypothetical protein EDC01DRAFT_631022 [Geopyxis carbonaria]|nr:hypothetical protein EDC01DRAFT_631022 [Geopyxis carbonaria]
MQLPLLETAYDYLFSSAPPNETAPPTRAPTRSSSTASNRTYHNCISGPSSPAASPPRLSPQASPPSSHGTLIPTPSPSSTSNLHQSTASIETPPAKSIAREKMVQGKTAGQKAWKTGREKVAAFFGRRGYESECRQCGKLLRGAQWICRACMETRYKHGREGVKVDVDGYGGGRKWWKMGAR